MGNYLIGPSLENQQSNTITKVSSQPSLSPVYEPINEKIELITKRRSVINYIKTFCIHKNWSNNINLDDIYKIDPYNENSGTCLIRYNSKQVITEKLTPEQYDYLCLYADNDKNILSPNIHNVNTLYEKYKKSLGSYYGIKDLANIKVNHNCIQTIPCQHEVALSFKDDIQGNQTIFNGIVLTSTEIILLHKYLSRIVPSHFIS